jgi:hypothetical protein
MLRAVQRLQPHRLTSASDLDFYEATSEGAFYNDTIVDAQGLPLRPSSFPALAPDVKLWQLREILASSAPSAEEKAQAGRVLQSLPVSWREHVQTAEAALPPASYYVSWDGKLVCAHPPGSVAVFQVNEF